MRTIEQILDLARWAPSGDNAQPWRFEIISDSEIHVHGYDTRDHCVYDLDGWASQLSHGALLEALRLAATQFGCRTQMSIADQGDNRHIVYKVMLERDPRIAEDPLAAAIRERVVQRRPMYPARLLPDQRLALERSCQPFSVMWLDSWHARWRMAALNARNAYIRLTIPEAFAVHKGVIAWNCTTSDDRLPSASLGAGYALLAIMRWAMASWERTSFLNRYAGGTILPRLIMDFVPGLFCSAHFVLIASNEPRSTTDRVAAGVAVQRFWLTATRLNLQIQPSYTPLVFARYAREQRQFTRVEKAKATAREIARRMDQLVGANASARAVFSGRIGPARAVSGRSLRLPLERLMIDKPLARL